LLRKKKSAIAAVKSVRRRPNLNGGRINGQLSKTTSLAKHDVPTEKWDQPRSRGRECPFLACVLMLGLNCVTKKNMADSYDCVNPKKMETPEICHRRRSIG